MEIPALKMFLQNRKKASQKFRIQFHHTPPNPDHYPHLYLWDSCFHAIVYARLNQPQYAAEEIKEILRGEDETGFIPGTRFIARAGRKFDPERIFFKKKDFGSDYSQPPVIALAAYETYQSLLKKNKHQADDFLKEIIPQLELFYSYFLKHRKNRDGLIYCIHPHETGRDSDPIFDSYKFRIQRNGPKTFFLINFLNTFLDYGSALHLNYKKNFNFVDTMFNCMLVDNLYILSDITKLDFYTKEADKLEKNILKTLKHDFVSISDLFPLILPHLAEKKLQEIVKALEDEHYFKVPYPIPSVAVNNRNFDPHYTEKGRLWRGPTWINTNWYLVERGFLMQVNRPDISSTLKKRIRKITENIKSQSQKIVGKGFYEFYDPLSGKGYRVKNFGMSALASVFS